MVLRRRLAILVAVIAVLAAMLLLAACAPGGGPTPPIAPAGQEQVEPAAPPAQDDAETGESEADEATDSQEAEDADTADAADAADAAAEEAAPPDSAATPILVQLSMAKAPMVGEEVELVMEVQSYDDAPAVTAQLDLPQGVDVVAGETRWEGPLLTGETTQLAVTIVFTEAGEYGISATALAPMGEGMVYGDDDAIFLTVSADEGHFGLDSGSDAELDVSPESD